MAQLIEECILRLEIGRRIKFFTVLLSALLKRSPPEAEKALRYIKQHTDQSLSGSKINWDFQWTHLIENTIRDIGCTMSVFFLEKMICLMQHWQPMILS